VLELRMTAPALSEWLTKQQAAETLGVSTKTIESFAAGGKLQSAKRSQIGRPPAVVYHPADVTRLANERHANPAYVVPSSDAGAGAVVASPRTSPTASPSASPIQAMQERTVEDLRLALRLAVERIQQDSGNPVALTDRVFLTVQEAAQLTGLPRTYLKELMREEKIPALKTGRGWRLRRRDLEAL